MDTARQTPWGIGDQEYGLSEKLLKEGIAATHGNSVKEGSLEWYMKAGRFAWEHEQEPYPGDPESALPMCSHLHGHDHCRDKLTEAQRIEVDLHVSVLNSMVLTLDKTLRDELPIFIIQGVGPDGRARHRAALILAQYLLKPPGQTYVRASDGSVFCRCCCRLRCKGSVSFGRRSARSVS